MDRVGIASSTCQRGKFSRTKLRLVEGLETKRHERVQLTLMFCVGQVES